MAKIRFGIVGYGNIGKRHAQHILQNPLAELIGICDTDSFTRHDAVTQQHPFYTNYKTFLEECNVDVVNVCTPNYLHATHTIEALKAGYHVVCEKPMALSTMECSSMMQAALESKKKIFVVKQNRYNAPVQEVKQLLQQNALGSLYMVSINCFWNRNKLYYEESNWRGKKQEDGGCLFTQFSHFIDILYYLFGEVRVLHGEVKNMNHAYTEVEDSGCFILETLDGCLVSFNFSTNSYEKNMEGAITILGELGSVKIGGQYLNTIEYQHIHQHQIPSIKLESKSNDYGHYQGSMSNHDKMIHNVVETLNGRSEIMTSADDGKKVVDIIERMYSATGK